MILAVPKRAWLRTRPPTRLGQLLGHAGWRRPPPPGRDRGRARRAAGRAQSRPRHRANSPDRWPRRAPSSSSVAECRRAAPSPSCWRISRAREGVAARRPELDQVGARDDAHKAPLLHHRHLAQVVFDHHLLHFIYRVSGCNVTAARCRGCCAPACRPGGGAGAVDIARVSMPTSRSSSHHRKTLVAIAPHELRGIAHRDVSVERVHVGRHDLAHRARAASPVSASAAQQLRLHLLKVRAFDQGGAALLWPPPPKRAQAAAPRRPRRWCCAR